jgi:hypothetical protein
VDAEYLEDLDTEVLDTRSRGICEFEKSQGMLTLHSGA